METLDVEISRAKRSASPLTVLMVDVDHFKKFNDEHGHVAGDEALKAVARVLKEVTREADHVARYGGEEFLVALPDTNIDGAVMAAERIREKLTQTGILVQGKSVTLTLSTGIAEFPADGKSPEPLIAAADAALYQAKRGGRDRVKRASRTRQTTAAKKTKSTKTTKKKKEAP
jgi:diguanylate cyclase (GGDEF)-like protein